MSITKQVSSTRYFVEPMRVILASPDAIRARIMDRRGGLAVVCYCTTERLANEICEALNDADAANGGA